MKYHAEQLESLESPHDWCVIRTNGDGVETVLCSEMLAHNAERVVEAMVLHNFTQLALKSLQSLQSQGVPRVAIHRSGSPYKIEEHIVLPGDKTAWYVCPTGERHPIHAGTREQAEMLAEAMEEAWRDGAEHEAAKRL